MAGSGEFDNLDQALITAMYAHPRAGALELSRNLHVVRATVQARLEKLEDSGVIEGYEPRINLAAAGFGVQAFVTLEIAQGALSRVSDELAAIPGVLEAYATTGDGDVLCRVAAESHDRLQQTLLELNQSGVVQRSTSVIALSVVVPPRVLPLLQSREVDRPATRAPAYRKTQQ